MAAHRRADWRIGRLRNGWRFIHSRPLIPACATTMCGLSSQAPLPHANHTHPNAGIAPTVCLSVLGPVFVVGHEHLLTGFLVLDRLCGRLFAACVGKARFPEWCASPSFSCSCSRKPTRMSSPEGTSGCTTKLCPWNRSNNATLPDEPVRAGHMEALDDAQVLPLHGTNFQPIMPQKSKRS